MKNKNKINEVYSLQSWQLAMVEFVVNNKIHSETKVLSFITNYGRVENRDGY